MAFSFMRKKLWYVVDLRCCADVPTQRFLRFAPVAHQIHSMYNLAAYNTAAIHVTFWQFFSDTRANMWYVACYSVSLSTNSILVLAFFSKANQGQSLLSFHLCFSRPIVYCFHNDTKLKLNSKISQYLQPEFWRQNSKEARLAP